MEPLAPWLTRDGLPPLPKTYKEPTLWDQMIDLTNLHSRPGHHWRRPWRPGVVGLGIKEKKMSRINLNAAEIRSGLDRVRYAEGLIQQLPPTHDGRNTLA